MAASKPQELEQAAIELLMEAAKLQMGLEKMVRGGASLLDTNVAMQRDAITWTLEHAKVYATLATVKHGI